MIERLLMSVFLVLAGWIIYRLVIHTFLGRPTPALENHTPGKPAIIYFSSPDCTPCKTVQSPAIHELQASLAEHLQVIEVDVTADPELADKWRVFSLPTTYILDARGQARHVNIGLADEHRLSAQLDNVISRPMHTRLWRTLLHRHDKR